MSNQQLYLLVGLPTITALVGILVNVGYFVVLNGRIDSVERRLDSRIDAVVAHFDARMNALETKFDILVGKVIELDNRLVRLEERLKH